MIHGHRVYAEMGTTIFEVMSRLADASSAVNLGQGFPDETGPKEILQKAADYILTGNNQYPPMIGVPALRNAIAAHEKRHWNIERNPQTDVVVTSGATEAIAACLLAFVSPGDEVIIFEPFYDAYPPLIERCGGKPVCVRLEAPDWTLDEAALRRAITKKTRAIILNDPLNPAAKVFTRDELDSLARVVREHDLVAIVDAVYEHLTFDGRPYIPLASLEDMNARTLKIGSAGKIFCVTGWKVGWITGPADLIRLVAKAHQFITFTTPPNLQVGVAYGLDEFDPWLSGLKKTMQDKRDHLASGLASAGMKVLPAQGTFFLNTSIAGTKWAGKDADYCKYITEHNRVAAIPLSAFYLDKPEASIVRFCFAKKYDVLDEAIRRLKSA